MPIAAAIPFIAMGASLLGGMASAQGQRQAGETSQAIGNYNAQINENDAQAALDKAKYDEQAQREDAAKLSARQRVLYAKAGVDITAGSPLLVMADSASQAEKDALAIRWEGATAAAKYRNQANLNRAYGDASKEAGDTAANATLLSSIGQAGAAYGARKVKGYGA